MPLSFDSPIALGITAALWSVILITAILRRVRLPLPAAICLSAGLFLLVPAAGRMHLQLPAPGQTVVMVDLSPSTRTAAYRDRSTLDHRIRTLLDGAPHRTLYFAEAQHETITANPLPDLPADRTRFIPPTDASAIVLFSDGQFDPPADAPPVFCVIDPQLAQTRDASIQGLQWQNEQAIITLHNQGDTPRQLTWNGQSAVVDPGHHRLFLSPTEVGASITAHLDPADPWPENDLLTLSPPSPTETTRWWVSRRPAPSPQWQSITPQQLPTSPNDWLNASIVVLDNLSADELTLPQQQRLFQYVDDLGGGLMILGGDRAFAAGGYASTAIDSLSPLASHPPQPTRHWLILTDASGSMAQQPDGNATRLQIATSAILAALRSLPPNDLVTLGSFAQSVRWWIEATPASETSHHPLPPPDLHPRGPTNLQAALQQTLVAVDPALPTDLLLLTDGQATLDDVDTFIDAMRQRNLRLHLLATGSGDAIPALEQIVIATGGQILRESDPRRWIDQTRALAQQAMPDHVIHAPIRVTSADASLPFATETAQLWNRTWLKDEAAVLATTTHASVEVPMIARWQAGNGRVLAAAYPMAPSSAAVLAESIATPPYDPRFAVRWTSGKTLGVRIDALENDQYLNELSLTLELAPANAPSDAVRWPIPQHAPGAYEVEIPAPRQPSIATVLHEDRVVHRWAVPGRYPAEFEAIGLNRATLTRLAERTGGRMVEPEDDHPLALPRRYQRIDTTAVCAAAAVALMGIGLLLWRRM